MIISAGNNLNHVVRFCGCHTQGCPSFLFPRLDLDFHLLNLQSEYKFIVKIGIKKSGKLFQIVLHLTDLKKVHYPNYSYEVVFHI